MELYDVVLFLHMAVLLAGMALAGALHAAVAGFALEGPHAQRLMQALADAPDGPTTPALVALASSRLIWLVSHGVTGMIVAVVANMVNKPGTPVSLLVIGAGAVVGALVGLVGRRGAP